MGVLALAVSYPWHACGETCNDRVVYVWSMMAGGSDDSRAESLRTIHAGAPAARA